MHTIVSFKQSGWCIHQGLEILICLNFHPHSFLYMQTAKVLVKQHSWVSAAPWWGVADSGLTGGTVVSLSKTLYSLLSTGSTLERSRHDWKIVDRDVKYQLKQNLIFPKIFLSYLTLIMHIFFVQKISFAYYECCIYSNALQTNFIVESNTMNPDQTPLVWSGFILFVIFVWFDSLRPINNLSVI